MENRAEKYSFNAKKAYEFAAGLREIIPGKNRTRKILIRKSRGRPPTSSAKEQVEIRELNNEEQLALLSDLQYAYKYSTKLMKKRLCAEVEDKFLSSVESPADIRYAIDYCNFFEIAMPTSLHNRVLMQTAIPVEKNGLSWREKMVIRRSERKQYKYLEQAKQQKKSFKIILEGLLKENNLTEDNAIKDLFSAMQ